MDYFLSAVQTGQTSFSHWLDRYDWSIKEPNTFSLQNNFFNLFQLSHEELSVPRSPPWRFEFPSMENSIPSGDLVLPS
jgi:hypothetical protein